ncbi:MAG TPA: ABC1 kinase family protein [Candidatus Binatia bacterium]|jgi:predicted unusual protein kinase regulating ubiquinone biosynthesis (AarF/ABC1/UbiB family)|nr:ABC1 kinase family protein [Candidatus Binatia bacterium]
MVTGQSRRFVAQAALVARVYAGYKLMQTLGRLGIGLRDVTWKNHHRRSAEAVYGLATRLEGLPIKVCQFLGSRADILPDEYVEVLSRLQDKVPARPFATLLPHLRESLGRPLEKAFVRFDETPIAAASLAQVHRARLHDGREVAVKIQYPEIAKLVQDDIQNLGVLLRILARLEPNFDFRVLLNEVTKLVPLELDFLHEADNAERMAECLKDSSDVMVPRVVRELSSERVLVSEFAEGVRVTDVPALLAMGVDPRAIARRLSELFAEMILTHGFFHGDPHPGNILVQPGGKIVLLDFGLAKALPPDFREGIVRLTMSIMGGQSSDIAAAFRGLGFRTRDESDESLAVLGEAFLGFALRNGRAYADRDIISQFNDEVPRAMKANPLVEIPGDILLVGRVMGILSGVGKQLGSDVDPAALLMPFLASPPVVDVPPSA